MVTAAHVIDAAHVYDRTIGISDGSNGFISVHGNWIKSAPTQPGGKKDPFDIAIYELPACAVARLKGKRFLRREDIDFHEQSGTVVFSLFGFPGMWAMSSCRAEESVSVKAPEFTTYAYAGSTESMLGYDAKYHLLIDSTPRDMTESDGSPAVVVRRDGQLATMPRDLKGISGCAVLTVGDLRVQVERWAEKHPKVVAVETGIYRRATLFAQPVGSPSRRLSTRHFHPCGRLWNSGYRIESTAVADRPSPSLSSAATGRTLDSGIGTDTANQRQMPLATIPHLL